MPHRNRSDSVYFFVSQTLFLLYPKRDKYAPEIVIHKQSSTYSRLDTVNATVEIKYFILNLQNPLGRNENNILFLAVGAYHKQRQWRSWWPLLMPLMKTHPCPLEQLMIPMTQIRYFLVYCNWKPCTQCIFLPQDQAKKKVRNVTYKVVRIF